MEAIARIADSSSFKSMVAKQAIAPKWILFFSKTLSIKLSNFFILPGKKIITLTNDGEAPSQIANLVDSLGYGDSPLFVFCHLGGDGEKKFESTANNWVHGKIADLNTVAIECLLEEGVEAKSRIPGLPDDSFEHDGQLTKREIRAITVSALSPMPGQLLWDIGAGCGSVSIEWLRANSDSCAFAIEKNMDRLEMINKNALALGAPQLKVIFGEALKELIGLPAPDAIFIGGGLTSNGLIDYCWSNLKPGGRLVANAVTFEGERLLIDFHRKYGGVISKIEISRAKPVGDFSGWQPHKPVTQLRVLK